MKPFALRNSYGWFKWPNLDTSTLSALQDVQVRLFEAAVGKGLVMVSLPKQSHF